MAIETLRGFAILIHKLLQSDRDTVIGVGGFTGEGKSCFTSQLQKVYSEVAGMKWTFSNMTWSRKELMKWIDGEKDSKEDEDGLRKGQMPEYSAIMPDELFTMFYKRNWYDEDQVSAIATFNMCRDRHLFVCGNVPDFWDLDSAFQKRVRFYVYIEERGVAHIFEQENNAFSSDPWNVNENKKQYRKKKTYRSCQNYVCTIAFEDWSPIEKKQYYKIRNKKRHIAIQEAKKDKVEQYRDIKVQRDNLIRVLINTGSKISTEADKSLCKPCHKSIKESLKPYSLKAISQATSLSLEAVRLIKEGLR